jgi:1-acyl-sn-glycerol-3-phosphate acyltransferase
MPTQSKFGEFLSKLRSYCFYDPLVFLYTGVLGAISLAASLFERSGKIQHKIERLWARMILSTVGIQVEVSGLENIDITKPHLYIANHLSAMDIPVLYAKLNFPFRIMAKQELFRYPVLGWHLWRSGQIPINSESALASMRSINRAVESLRAGMPLVVFPEGGRSENGLVQPFQRGAFYAAIKAQVEIVPVALIGTFEMLPMNSFHIRPRPVKMVMGSAIATTGYGTRDMEKVAQIAQAAVEGLYYPNAEMTDPRAKPEAIAKQ